MSHTIAVTHLAPSSDQLADDDRRLTTCGFELEPPYAYMRGMAESTDTTEDIDLVTCSTCLSLAEADADDREQREAIAAFDRRFEPEYGDA